MGRKDRQMRIERSEVLSILLMKNRDEIAEKVNSAFSPEEFSSHPKRVSCSNVMESWKALLPGYTATPRIRSHA